MSCRAFTLLIRALLITIGLLAVGSLAAAVLRLTAGEAAVFLVADILGVLLFLAGVMRSVGFGGGA